MADRKNYLKAISNLTNGKGFSVEGEDYSTLVVIDGEKPSEYAINQEIAFLDDLDQKNAYIELRRAEYPSVEDQLDLLYDDKVNGTNKWVDALTVIKDKYPKPEEA